MHIVAVVSSSSSQRRRSHSRSLPHPRSACRPRGGAPTRVRYAGHTTALMLGISATVGRSQACRLRQRLPLLPLVNRLAPSPLVLRTPPGDRACTPTASGGPSMAPGLGGCAARRALRDEAVWGGRHREGDGRLAEAAWMSGAQRGVVWVQ
jgi:hypothetical protein